jgi:hypothetical protein
MKLHRACKLSYIDKIYRSLNIYILTTLTIIERISTSYCANALLTLERNLSLYNNFSSFIRAAPHKLSNEKLTDKTFLLQNYITLQDVQGFFFESNINTIH